MYFLFPASFAMLWVRSATLQMLEVILHICSKCNTPKDFSVMGHHLGNDVLVWNTARIHECIIHMEQIEYVWSTYVYFFWFLRCFLKEFFFMKYYSFFCSIHNQMIQKETNKESA